MDRWSGHAGPLELPTQGQSGRHAPRRRRYSSPWSPPSVLAAAAVPVAVEPVVVFADDGHWTGVLGAVAAAPFAVVVRRVRIEACPAVVRIAFGCLFARFRFGPFAFFGFGACFFAGLRLGGGMSCPAPGCFAPRPAARRFATMTCGGSARLASLLPFSRRFGRDPR